MRSVTNNGDSNWRKLLLTESACSQLSSNTQSATSTSFMIIIILAIYMQNTQDWIKKPLSSTVTLSKSYKYLLKKRIKYDWTNKELFLPCQYYRRSKKTEFYRFEHFQICQEYPKYFFPTGSRISKWSIWQNSVFLRHPVTFNHIGIITFRIWLWFPETGFERTTI